tara:strand:- start:109 stop:417 length:309 start_codon:yes stop_codon:yes gene_type:complete
MKEKRTYDNYKEHSNDISYENEVRIENKMFLANNKMRAKIIESLIAHAEGHIKKHKANIDIFLENPAGVAEHPDVLETIEKELKIIAEYDDQINMLKKYFSS